MPQVPGEVYAAFTTDRPEFLKLLRGRLNAGGDVLTKAQANEIVDLLHIAISEREEDRAKVQALLRQFDGITSAIRGLPGQLDRLYGIAETIGTDRPLPERE